MLFILIFVKLNYCNGLIEIKFLFEMLILILIKMMGFFFFLQENVLKVKEMIVFFIYVDFLFVENVEEFFLCVEIFLEKFID